ncbi:MAG: endopeptidase La [Vicingaceae bacterium]
MKDAFDIDNLFLRGPMDEEAEFIPLMTNEDEEQMNAEQLPDELPIMPLRNTVLFPGVVIPITVGRDKSIRLIKDANKGSKLIGVVSQLDESIEDPVLRNLYTVGTMARIIKIFRMPDGNTTVILQGKKRFKLEQELSSEPYLTALISSYPNEEIPKGASFEALVSSIKDMALKIIEHSPNIPTEATFAIRNIDSPSFMINFIASNMNIDVKDKQALLEEKSLQNRANLLLKHMTKDLQLLELKNDIQSKVRLDMDQQQKEYFLHQQMKQIQEELGGNPQEEEIKEFREKATKKKWPKEVSDRFEKELLKLQRTNSASAEYSVQINYLESLVELPWDEVSKDNFDLKRAKKILDRDHYGLDKVKDRILEHLAVLKLKGNMKSPILCLYGPPGVGKTSLGKSIAEALGRKYVRMSVGGLKDEAEIRGHRRTYIGAMPGRILQNLKKVKYSNPVFVLDEIDKIGNDYHGDPSSALLEVLDPEQNFSFNDHFIELDYNLSNVLFVATANSLGSIQPALRDRMEIIEINGYTLEEKVEIARRHLVPKLVRDHGLEESDFKISKQVIAYISENYTRESGVRGLEKRLAKVVRHIAKCKVTGEEYNMNIVLEKVIAILGPAHSKDKYQGNDVAGVVTGLAWTPFGGDILFIESSLSQGKGGLTLTGNLGEVMKESAKIALQYIKSKHENFGLEAEVFRNWDVHIHVPEGATPKDGPSAGIALLTSLLSIFTQRKVRKNLAMSGEITLRGRVLPVGGIKEKILAAKRANIKEIVLSEDNEKDIQEINSKYLKGLKFHFVKDMTEVLEYALLDQQVKGAMKIT